MRIDILYNLSILFSRDHGSGIYKINVGPNRGMNVYCQMSSVSGCSGGGWTMVMKIDGSQVRVILKTDYDVIYSDRQICMYLSF